MAGVVVVEWWTTVAVCAGAVTVSVRAGVVTVWVRAGSVTVSVDVVFCATVPVSRLDPLDESVAVVVALDDVSGRAVDLHFGPVPPKGSEARWIQTIPDKGWFVYFRIYGPEQPAFDDPSS